MTDVLIRNVPEDQLRAIDAKAARLGLSRSDYLRRQIAEDAAAADRPKVSTDDIAAWMQSMPDLADEELMRRAWIRE